MSICDYCGEEVESTKYYEMEDRETGYYDSGYFCQSCAPMGRNPNPRRPYNE